MGNAHPRGTADKVANKVANGHVRASLRDGQTLPHRVPQLPGHLCFGPSQGVNVTFVRADRIDGWKTLDPMNRYPSAARRYISTHGPSPIRIPRTGSGLPAMPRLLFEKVGDELKPA